MKPRLADVTLCCIDTARPLAALRAMRKSQAQCDFGRSLLITNTPLGEEGLDCHLIPTLADGAAFSRFVLKDLGPLITTPFVLLVQWDGYVLDGQRWSSDFLLFDYVGAVWPWLKEPYRVGNGGFSLRSRKLLDALADPAIPAEHPDDVLICQTARHHLLARDIRFADEPTASRFSFERGNPGPGTFGFHGWYNFWRFTPAAELPELFELISPRALTSGEAFELLAGYVMSNQWREARLLLSQIQHHLGGEMETLNGLSKITGGQIRPEQLYRLILQRGSQ